MHLHVCSKIIRSQPFFYNNKSPTVGCCIQFSSRASTDINLTAVHLKSLVIIISAPRQFALRKKMNAKLSAIRNLRAASRYRDVRNGKAGCAPRNADRSNNSQILEIAILHCIRDELPGVVSLLGEAGNNRAWRDGQFVMYRVVEVQRLMAKTRRYNKERAHPEKVERRKEAEWLSRKSTVNLHCLLISSSVSLY